MLTTRMDGSNSKCALSESTQMIFMFAISFIVVIFRQETSNLAVGSCVHMWSFEPDLLLFLGRRSPNERSSSSNSRDTISVAMLLLIADLVLWIVILRSFEQAHFYGMYSSESHRSKLNTRLWASGSLHKSWSLQKTSLSCNRWMTLLIEIPPYSRSTSATSEHGWRAFWKAHRVTWTLHKTACPNHRSTFYP